MIWRFHPAIDWDISRAELEALPAHIIGKIHRHSEYLPERDVFRLGADGDYYMNHSDQPNLRDAGDAAYAARDIMAGEELVCDYRIIKVLAFDPDVQFQFAK